MRYDHEAEFERRWHRWPADRRTKYFDCQMMWVMLMDGKSDEEQGKLMAHIDRGITHWIGSKGFRDGFSFSFHRFLWQKEWRAVPAEEPAPVVADAPPLECGCGEQGCAICRVLVRCG